MTDGRLTAISEERQVQPIYARPANVQRMERHLLRRIDWLMSHVQRGIVDSRREDRMLKSLGAADTRRREDMLNR